MQQSYVIVTAALLLAGVSNVWAASSVDLSVTGMITPSACTPDLSNGGVVDYGKISVQDLETYRETQLPDATLTLTVNCEATALIAVKATDNRKGTVAGWGDSFFGLGLATGDKKIGRYLLKTDNAIADGVARAVIESDFGQVWFEAWGTGWQPGWMRSMNGGSSQLPAPLPLQTFKTDLIVSTWISDKRGLPTAEEILIDGSATLDIVYL